MTDIRFRGERIVYELALMDSQAIYGGSLRDQFMCLAPEQWIDDPQVYMDVRHCTTMYVTIRNVCIVIYIYYIVYTHIYTRTIVNK